jgi:Na+-driven multidrug efflux pump
MVSRLSADAIVAVGFGMQVWGIFYATIALIYTGQNALMSRFVGDGMYKKASMVISTLFWFVAAIALPVILFWQYIGVHTFGVYIGLVADPMVKAVIFWREFQKGAWRRLKI